MKQITNKEMVLLYFNKQNRLYSSYYLIILILERW